MGSQSYAAGSTAGAIGSWVRLEFSARASRRTPELSQLEIGRQGEHPWSNRVDAVVIVSIVVEDIEHVGDLESQGDLLELISGGEIELGEAFDRHKLIGIVVHRNSGRTSGLSVRFFAFRLGISSRCA